VCVKIRRNCLRQQQKQSEILRFAIFRSVVKTFDVAWSSWSIFLLVYGRLNVINTESLSTLLIILEHYYNYFSTPPYNKTLHCFFFLVCFLLFRIYSSLLRLSKLAMKRTCPFRNKEPVGLLVQVIIAEYAIFAAL
jgi:hypothetical protein